MTISRIAHAPGDQFFNRLRLKRREATMYQAVGNLPSEETLEEEKEELEETDEFEETDETDDDDDDDQEGQE